MSDIAHLSALVVGFGSIGRRHTRILQELGLKDIRVCDPLPEAQQRAQSQGILLTYPSYEDALSDNADTVIICSPTALHVTQAIQAVLAGKDVLIEKPLSASIEGVDELDRLAQEKKRIVMVAHCFRFHEGLLLAKNWMEEGRIGRLISIRAIVGEYIPEVMPNYKNMYISQYNGVYELMHDIDLALWYADQPPISVFGIDGNFSDVEMKSPDMAEMIIEFQDRCLASVHLDFFERARHRQIQLLGTDGTIIVEFARWDKCVMSIYQAKSGYWTTQEIVTDRDDMFRAEDTAFFQSVLQRTPPPIDIATGRVVLEVMLAAQESSRLRRAIRIVH